MNERARASDIGRRSIDFDAYRKVLEKEFRAREEFIINVLPLIQRAFMTEARRKEIRDRHVRSLALAELP